MNYWNSISMMLTNQNLTNCLALKNYCSMKLNSTNPLNYCLTITTNQTNLNQTNLDQTNLNQNLAKTTKMTKMPKNNCLKIRLIAKMNSMNSMNSMMPNWSNYLISTKNYYANLTNWKIPLMTNSKLQVNCWTNSN